MTLTPELATVITGVLTAIATVVAAMVTVGYFRSRDGTKTSDGEEYGNQELPNIRSNQNSTIPVTRLGDFRECSLSTGQKLPDRQIYCPACDSELTAPLKWAGIDMRCPKCSQMCKLPASISV